MARVSSPGTTATGSEDCGVRAGGGAGKRTPTAHFGLSRGRTHSPSQAPVMRRRCCMQKRQAAGRSAAADERDAETGSAGNARRPKEEGMANADRTGGWTAPSGLYNAAVDMVDRNVAEGRGDKLAFMDRKRLLTYAELQGACNRMANVLPRLGIGRERRVAMIMLDDVDFPVVFWGAIKAGVVPVPLNTLLPPETWRYMIEDSRADAVVISADLLARAHPMLEEAAARRHLHVIVPGGEDDALTLGFERLMARSEPHSEA